jgi:ubiquinone/menaquinone biosynthesis C-methylase UbiE
MTARMLSHREARGFYDRLGSKQDLQRFFEQPAFDALIAGARFPEASAVIELGCGTGAFAERLLREQLPQTATYLGLDASTTMVRLARSRLLPWAGRARVEQTDGTIGLPVADGSCDRVVSAYVLDLLSDEDIRAALSESRRVLAPHGLLCLAGLAFGATAASRIVSALWRRIHALHPLLVGGCRPLRVREYVGDDWCIHEHRKICRFGICSEVLVAS